jgi:hypothetical protein
VYLCSRRGKDVYLKKNYYKIFISGAKECRCRFNLMAGIGLLFEDIRKFLLAVA